MNEEQREDQEIEFAKSLNRLLADEYILMNKTSTCIYKIATHGFEKVPQLVYDELKIIVQEITNFLKKKKLSALASINDILKNTRLSNQFDLSSKAAQFSILINDHSAIASNIESELNSSSYKMDNEVKNFFEEIKKRHKAMEEKLKDYFSWSINNYKRQSA